MNNTNPVTVIFADDHQMMRAGFCTLFKSTEIKVLATAGDGEELLQLVKKHQPQVVVTDIRMPVMDGIKVTAIIKREFPQIKVMALSAYDESYLIMDMLQAGATGFAIKNANRDELITGIRQMNMGQRFFCSVIALKLLQLDEHPESPVDFTDREKEVIKWICLGSSNKEISKKLGINLRTVETHRAHIYKKMGVKTAVAMAIFARKYGLY